MYKQHINNLIKNHKVLSSIISIILTVFSISYGVASYVIYSHESMEDAARLRMEFTEYKKTSESTHKDFDRRLNEYEKEFKMTTTKLDVTLAKISTDLQFIKEQLMSRGMNK